MRVTIEGLRRWIVVTTALLLALVAGLIIYGRNRFRHIEKDLPARLGMNIQQTANGFSYTQTNQGHALFTLKASKELQLKSGHVLLHDVDITLYGPPGSGRTDRIFGSDFDYDQSQGLITSQGDVDIELQGTSAPTPTRVEWRGERREQQHHPRANPRTDVSPKDGRSFDHATGGVPAAARCGHFRGSGLQLENRRCGAEQSGAHHNQQQWQARGRRSGARHAAAIIGPGFAGECDPELRNRRWQRGSGDCVFPQRRHYGED